MKITYKRTLLVQLIIILSMIQGSMNCSLPSTQALQLVQKNMLEVIKSLASDPVNSNAYQAYITENVRKFSWLPGYIIKKDPDSRIKVVNDILRPCIEEHNLNLLRLPELWRVPFVTKRSIA